jgi:hypothetical protein
MVGSDPAVWLHTPTNSELTPHEARRDVAKTAGLTRAIFGAPATRFVRLSQISRHQPTSLDTTFLPLHSQHNFTCKKLYILLL